MAGESKNHLWALKRKGCGASAEVERPAYNVSGVTRRKSKKLMLCATIVMRRYSTPLRTDNVARFRIQRHVADITWVAAEGVVAETGILRCVW